MKILFVGNVWSPHTARWINQITGQGWDIHMFPSRDLELSPLLKNVTVHDLSTRPIDADPSVRTPGASLMKRGLRYLQRHLNLPQTAYDRPTIPPITSFSELDQYAKAQGPRIASLIKRLKPDLVHSLQLQFDSYPTLEAKKILGARFPKWAVSNWGADIHHFREFPDHAARIRDVLANCNFYSCECCRDIDFALQMGFRGVTLPVIPNTGGYDLQWVQQFRHPGKTSERRVIAVKGYKDWVYRGLVALDALKMCREDIIAKGYTIAIYLGGTVMKEKAEEYGLPFEMIPYSPHEDILRLHGRSRVSIGLSMSDGASTSFLEAIVMGAFPIQSFTSCADEWVRNGETGFLVPPEDAETVAGAIRTALRDDSLVDRAAEINAKTVTERLDCNKIRPTAINIYQKIFEG